MQRSGIGRTFPVNRTNPLPTMPNDTQRSRTLDEELDACKNPGNGAFISTQSGRDSICLDGYFTPEELARMLSVLQPDAEPLRVGVSVVDGNLRIYDVATGRDFDLSRIIAPAVIQVRGIGPPLLRLHLALSTVTGEQGLPADVRTLAHDLGRDERTAGQLRVVESFSDHSCPNCMGIDPESCIYNQ